MEKITEEEKFWIWLAGFIDGEGTISVWRHNHKTYSQGFAIKPYVEISSTDKQVIKEIQNNLPFFNYDKKEYTTRNKIRWKPLYRVSIGNSGTIKLLLNKLLPFLKLKNRQGELLLKLINKRGYKSTRGKDGKFLEGKKYTKRENKIINELANLNKRGKQNNTNPCNPLKEGSEFWIWLSGFIDGEGTIGITKAKGKGHFQGWAYDPYISIVNTNLNVIKEISSILKSNVITQNKKFNSKIYIVSIANTKKIEFVTKKLLPNLRIKKLHAKFMLSYLKSLKEREARIIKARKDHIKRGTEIYQKLRLLNKKGR